MCIEPIFPLPDFSNLFLAMFVLVVVGWPAGVIDIVPVLSDLLSLPILFPLFPTASLSPLPTIQIVHVVIIRSSGCPVGNRGLRSGRRWRRRSCPCARLPGHIVRRRRWWRRGNRRLSYRGLRVLASYGFCLCFLSGHLRSFGGLKSERGYGRASIPNVSTSCLAPVSEKGLSFKYRPELAASLQLHRCWETRHLRLDDRRRAHWRWFQAWRMREDQGDQHKVRIAAYRIHSQEPLFSSCSNIAAVSIVNLQKKL